MIKEFVACMVIVFIAVFSVMIYSQKMFDNSMECKNIGGNMTYEERTWVCK